MLLPSKENLSAKVEYKFYATLLDAYQWYLDSEYEESFQEFIDKLNRVPFTSEAAAKGTAFNELVDKIKNGELVAVPLNGYSESKAEQQLHIMLKRNAEVVEYAGFDFKWSIVEKFVGLFTNALDQVYIEAVLPTSKGNVLLYGYIDEVLPGGPTCDIKCTGSYDFPKFLKNFQHIVYPYCMNANGIHTDQFRYDITDYNNHYQELYTFDVIRDTQRLVRHCERLIDFLESQRDKITDKKVFALDGEPEPEAVPVAD